jgi:anaerobic ribonucleoside-triphosphate reductase activating protein
MVSHDVVRVAGITNESVVDGPGIRSTIFFQGCPHACPGCHNPETWSSEGGKEFKIADLIKLLAINPLVSGITFSGGEPFQQAPAAAALGRRLREMGLNLWVYTGYTWEVLLASLERPGYQELLELAEVLIDGPFLREKQDLGLLFRGSTNQRLINVQESLTKGMVVTWQPSGMGG